MMENKRIKLFRGAEVFAPDAIGQRDVLVVDEKIAAIDKTIAGFEGVPDVDIIDLTGKKLTPAFVDIHVHITGGGGEQGFSSRVPEATLSSLLTCGVATAVGLLGTDGVTRSLDNLIAKARALTEEGMTVYALTGSYGYPSVTITGSVERDIMLIPPFIGAKIAVSDHRSSNPLGPELASVATAARRGGMLSGSAGITTLHMGSGDGALSPVFWVLDHSDVPAKNIVPTHMLRSKKLIEQGIKLIRRGGTIDCTAGSTDEEASQTAAKLAELFALNGVSEMNISVSSDAFGSQPRFNAAGECVGLTYSTPRGLLAVMRALIERGVALDRALRPFTSTPAATIGKQNVKGSITVNADADLIVFSDEMSIDRVYARGRLAAENGRAVMKGRFEE